MKRGGRTSLVLTLCVLLLGSVLPPPARGVAGAQQRPADGLVIARVSVGSQQEVERLVRLGLDLLETREGDDLFILSTAAEVARLRAQGWRVNVDERKTALLRSQRPELRQTRVGAAQTGTAALTVAPAAAAPSNLTASTNFAGRIDLKWADNSNNENGFRIERCPGSTCTNFALLTTVGANTTSYRNSSLPAGTTYRYRVRANTSVGYSVYSNVATGRTK